MENKSETEKIVVRDYKDFHDHIISIPERIVKDLHKKNIDISSYDPNECLPEISRDEFNQKFLSEIKSVANNLGILEDKNDKEESVKNFGNFLFKKIKTKCDVSKIDRITSENHESFYKEIFNFNSEESKKIFENIEIINPTGNDKSIYSEKVFSSINMYAVKKVIYGKLYSRYGSELTESLLKNLLNDQCIDLSKIYRFIVDYIFNFEVKKTIHNVLEIKAENKKHMADLIFYQLVIKENISDVIRKEFYDKVVSSINSLQRLEDKVNVLFNFHTKFLQLAQNVLGINYNVEVANVDLFASFIIFLNKSRKFDESIKSFFKEIIKEWKKMEKADTSLSIYYEEKEKISLFDCVSRALQEFFTYNNETWDAEKVLTPEKKQEILKEPKAYITKTKSRINKIKDIAVRMFLGGTSTLILLVFGVFLADLFFGTKILGAVGIFFLAAAIKSAGTVALVGTSAGVGVVSAVPVTAIATAITPNRVARFFCWLGSKIKAIFRGIKAIFTHQPKNNTVKTAAIKENKAYGEQQFHEAAVKKENKRSSGPSLFNLMSIFFCCSEPTNKVYPATVGKYEIEEEKDSAFLPPLQKSSIGDDNSVGNGDGFSYVNLQSSSGTDPDTPDLRSSRSRIFWSSDTESYSSWDSQEDSIGMLPENN